VVISKVYGSRYVQGSISIGGKRYWTQYSETDRDKARAFAKTIRNKDRSVRVVETRDGFFVVSHKNLITKMFGKYQYTFHGPVETESQADGLVDDLRKKGLAARRTKASIYRGHYIYQIWQRDKKRVVKSVQ
jgi:hypothetical protein